MRVIMFKYIFKHFRTGDIKTRVMTIDDLEDGNWGDTGEWEEDGYHCEARLQFTGLKDRDGKEIYESDIWLPNGCETPRIIVWYKYGWWFQYPGGGVTRPVEYTEDGTVIGNLYEHPHLLKEVQNG